MQLNISRALFCSEKPNADQLAWRRGPRYPADRFDAGAVGTGYYVYVHEDEHGSVFYVGKGSGSRAWSADRDPLWERFVSTRLTDRRYWIRLVATGLDEEDALELEDSTMALFGDALVNRFNMSRSVDDQAFERHRTAVEKMTLLMAKSNAESNPTARVRMLEEAMELHYGDGQVRYDTGIAAELTTEMGGYGNTKLITALVDAYLLALDPAAAQAALARYLNAHPREAQLKAIQKLQAKASKGKAPRKRVQFSMTAAPGALCCLSTGSHGSGAQVPR